MLDWLSNFQPRWLTDHPQFPKLPYSGGQHTVNIRVLVKGLDVGFHTTHANKYFAISVV